MGFVVEDFGCVADGRCLEKVSISADTAVLTVADGSLIATEVGKRIAIPGAIDMEATIAELDPMREITDATIGPGGAMLVAVFAEGETPLQDGGHEGWRITVEGAGPGGVTLLTDVVRVTTGGTHIELATPATTLAEHVRAVLNQRDRAVLSDHARATVGPVTVQLADRVITDAAMNVGSRVLRSATAAFSDLDRGTAVEVAAAGHLNTTIVNALDDTTVELAEPALRTVTNGTADIWRVEDDALPGFLDVLSAIGATGVGPAEIVFGPGVYDFSRLPPGMGNLPAAIGLEGLTGITLRGAGQGVTTLRLMPEQDLTAPGTQHALDTHVLMARNCRGLTVRDLTVHGTFLTMSRATVQMHAIHIAQGCRDTVIERVGVVHSAGDAIRLIGEPDNLVHRVWINGCRLVRSKRTGIAVQRSVEMLWIRDCYIEMALPSTGACIDLEPTGGGAPTDLVIDSNILAHSTPAVAVSLSGTGGGPPARRIRFTGNTLTGGGMGGVNARDVTVAGNIVVAGPTGQVMVFRGIDDLHIRDNAVRAGGGSRSGISVARRPGVESSRVRISGNDIEVGGIGIDLTSGGNHLEVSENRVLGTSENIGIRVELAGAGAHRDVRIVDNSLTNFGVAGIRLVGRSGVETVGVEISGNDLHLDTPAPPAGLVGISLEGPNVDPSWVRRVVVTGNRISPNVPVKFQRPGVPFVSIGGNPDGRAIYEGDEDPNDLVSAPPGSLYLLAVPGGATGLFLKTAGTSDTGWVQVTLVGP